MRSQLGSGEAFAFLAAQIVSILISQLKINVHGFLSRIALFILLISSLFYHFSFISVLPVPFLFILYCSRSFNFY